MRLSWWLTLLVSVTLVCSGLGWAPGQVQAADNTKDPNAYNYLPISFGAGSGGDLRDSILEGLVFQNGYEVQCAAPQWKIKPQLFGEWKRWFELHPGEPMIAKSQDGGDKYEIKMGNAALPMLRGDENFNLTNKISSLEAFFGAVNPALPAGKINSSGVVQNLLNDGQQCGLKMGNLEAIKTVCDKLDPSSECYMNRIIPQTNMKMLDLYSKLNAIESAYQGNLAAENQRRAGTSEQQLSGNFCQDFTQRGIDSNVFNLTDAKRQSYLQALTNTPLDVDTLYRIAFLVIAPTHNLKTSDTDIFWFWQHPSPHDVVLEAPIIVAFRVPDFTMNKPLKLSTLNDSGQITNHLLKSNELNHEQELAARSMRDSKLKKAMAARYDNLNDAKALIYCRGLDQCPPPPPPSDPKLALRQALMDIVNGLGPRPSCDGLGGYIENAGDISTSTGFNDEKRLFLPGLLQTFIPQTDSQKFDWHLTVTEKDASGGDIKDPDKTVEVNAWVISPSGVNLENFEQALQSFFSPDTFKSMVDANCLPDESGKCGAYPERYPFKAPSATEPIAKFYSSSGEVPPFIDPEDPIQCDKQKVTDPITGEQTTVTVCRPKYKHAGAMLVENRGDLGMKGAKLGWLVRKIEEVIRPIDIQIKCSRTEDLFLGKCKIVPIDQAKSDNPTPSSLISCSLELADNPEIDKHVKANKADYLAEIKKLFPNTLMTSDLFDYVFDYTKSNGWNPAVILALGREETAWGAVGDPHMLGCMAGDPGSLSDPKLKMKQQMDCVFLNFSTSMSCVNFECKYSEGTDANACVFATNPKFPGRIDFYYRSIVAPYDPPNFNTTPTPAPTP